MSPTADSQPCRGCRHPKVEAALTDGLCFGCRVADKGKRVQAHEAAKALLECDPELKQLVKLYRIVGAGRRLLQLLESPVSGSYATSIGRWSSSPEALRPSDPTRYRDCPGSVSIKPGTASNQEGTEAHAAFPELPSRLLTMDDLIPDQILGPRHAPRPNKCCDSRLKHCPCFHDNHPCGNCKKRLT